jgi:glycerol-3-phosphate O-acyltransferase
MQEKEKFIVVASLVPKPLSSFSERTKNESLFLSVPIATSVMKIACISMAVCLSWQCVSIQGWSSQLSVSRPPSSSAYYSRLSSSALQSSTVDATESTASSSSTPNAAHENPTLLPEYEESYQKFAAKLAGSVPPQYAKMTPALLHFMREYYGANQDGFTQTQNPESTPDLAGSRFLQGVAYGLEFGILNKYDKFGSYHKALRGNPEKEDGNTVDFYKFGCDFFRPCMNLPRSKVEGMEYLKEAMDYLEQGHNVILFANHQSEADPQVMSTCFETVGYGPQAAQMVYVAGHKVTTDPLAVPFSMGRNLICIHSKKHIDADPESKPHKQRQNLEAMSAMLNLFKKGGCLLWVAPSGGRDRRNVETGEIPIAPFDSKTIDMFRLMGTKSKTPTHYYPVAMVTYELCPPPDYVDAGVGEQRNVRFGPVGIAIGPEVILDGGLEARREFCQQAFDQCEKDYKQLLALLNM